MPARMSLVFLPASEHSLFREKEIAMELDPNQVLDLILENQKSIEEIRSELSQIKYWIAAGALLAIPYALFIHRYLHPTERFFEKKIKEADRLLEQAKN